MASIALRRSARARRPAGVFLAGFLAILGLVLLTSGCGKKGDAKSAPAAGGAVNAKAPAGGRPGGGPPAEPAINVAVDPVRRGEAAQLYKTTATLEAENRAELLARTGGVVAKLLVEEGTSVRAGQSLLRLDQAEASLRVRQAEVEVAKQKSIWDRQKASFDQQVIPQSEFDLAKTNFEAAQAALELAQHQLSYTDVQAPFSGTVIRRLVNNGQTVNVGTPLFEIANFKPLLARVHVPAKELGTLQDGQPAALSLDSNGATLQGVVRLVSPVVDPTTGTVKVTVWVHDYPPGTRPGDFVHVSVVTARHENVLRVPNLAVFEDRGERIVYVAQDSVAARRPVQIGFIDESHTEVLTGLEAGDLVVVKGHRSLKDGSPIKILEGLAEKSAAVTAIRQGS